MTDANTLLQRLRRSLHILEQRQAKLGLDAPASLVLEIEDHEKAITLTEQLAAGHLTETAWRKQLQPLLVTIEERQATEAVSALNIGGVNFSNVSGSTITVGNIDASVHAGGDVVGGNKTTQSAEGSNIAQASHGGNATVNVTDLRGQQVSGDQYNAGRDVNINQSKKESPVWRAWSVFLGIVTIIGVIIALFTVPQFNAFVFPEPTVTPTPLPVTPAAEGESLIVIAAFYEPTNGKKSEPHRQIKQAIKEAAAKEGLNNLRVEVEPTILTGDQPEEAKALGSAYNAEMIIWGEDTGSKVWVNFYNLKQPDFDAADVSIIETNRTEVVNPSAYGKFIVGDLPKQLTFLAFFAVGQSYYSNEQYQRAAEVIEAGITAVEEPDSDINPDGLAEAYFRLGWLYEALDDPQTANIRYTSSVTLAPSLEVYNNRGNTYANLERYDEALADYTVVIHIAPDFVPAYNNRGLTYHDLKQYDKALVDYSKAIRLNPVNAVAYYNRGNTYAALEQYDKALADYTKAIHLNPDDVVAYYNRGNTYAALEQYDKALVDYSEAIRLDPDFAVAYYGRGDTYAKQDKLKHAIKNIEIGLQVDRNPNTHQWAEKKLTDLKAQLENQ
ncbi:MAG: tetratricopeptide repeat protein [Anaerolineae bacterium]|nr:tetratricopeptide repeat protein [Anaerolineae bacterium]